MSYSYARYQSVLSPLQILDNNLTQSMDLSHHHTTLICPTLAFFSINRNIYIIRKFRSLKNCI